LTPLFKSERDYNILFAECNGDHAAAQFKLFTGKDADPKLMRKTMGGWS
jgi:hypothetical protein